MKYPILLLNWNSFIIYDCISQTGTVWIVAAIHTYTDRCGSPAFSDGWGVWIACGFEPLIGTWKFSAAAMSVSILSYYFSSMISMCHNVSRLGPSRAGVLLKAATTRAPMCVFIARHRPGTTRPSQQQSRAILCQCTQSGRCSRPCSLSSPIPGTYGDMMVICNRMILLTQMRTSTQ